MTQIIPKKRKYLTREIWDPVEKDDEDYPNEKAKLFGVAAKNNIPDIQLEKDGLIIHSARIRAKKANAHNRDVGVRGRPPVLNCSQQT
ncbi:hypothetical protein BLNAU_8771 [Blattamonas nauphoetae]|uniref:Transposase n=1 Tax=Blattamonas nauphoetae TaxID=2049346 RepID=A0ABQ9XXH3_9EUKA|nr:hypothetical protein BLNAU_8771 [Blattamonas nauphoetae]